jgi:S-adenosylmethionine decarboxylase
MNGLHLVADLHHCRGDVPLDDPDALRTLCLSAVADAGLHSVGSLFHPFVGEDGQAQGVTGVVLLVESHLAVHTWPELRSVTADVYVCNFGADNSARAEAVMARLVEVFRPDDRKIERMQRG